MTEMNDDTGDGASEFKATLTFHSYSELVLYPWGHCTSCESPDHEQLIYHGDMMATMTDYENMQSSDLYPTSGDFCDWHYGVHGSYCYTMEIGTAFHQHEDDIDHIAVRNIGVAFYMAKIADNPRERADFGLADVWRTQVLEQPGQIEIPNSGPVPISMCLDYAFSLDYDSDVSHMMYRFAKPSRAQSDYGKLEWFNEEWEMTEFELVEGENCALTNSSEEGYKIVAHVPVPEASNGELHYKAMITTLGGTQKVEYPDTTTEYYVLDISYRAPFGSLIGSIALFGTVALFVWGGLGVCLRMMMNEGEEVNVVLLVDADLLEDSS